MLHAYRAVTESVEIETALEAEEVDENDNSDSESDKSDESSDSSEMDAVQYVDSNLEKSTPQEMIEILWNTPVDEFGDVLLYAVGKNNFVNHGNDIDHIMTRMEHLRLAMEHSMAD